MVVVEAEEEDTKEDTQEASRSSSKEEVEEEGDEEVDGEAVPHSPQDVHGDDLGRPADTIISNYAQ